ncbi:MAG: hypothetical protein ACK5NK_12505 [Niabella sp.]
MKLLTLLLAFSLLLLACSKNDIPKQPSVDYSIYKIKTAMNKQVNYSSLGKTYTYDTCDYTYSGSDISYEDRSVTASSTNLYSYKYTLNDGMYVREQYTNGVLGLAKFYFKLGSSGYIDTIWLMNNGTVSQSGKYWRNTDGSTARSVAHYSGYDSYQQLTYQNGNILYAFSGINALTTTYTSTKDSVAYEYYTQLPYMADYYAMGLPPSLYNKPTKNLLKKMTYYNLLNNKNIYQTREYSYEVDAIGLVTKSTQTFYSQPGNVIGRSDTTTYTYYNH